MQNLCTTKSTFFIYLAAIFLNCSNGAILQASDWSTPVNLSSCGANTTSAKVTFDSMGRIMAVWSEFNGSHYVIQSSSKNVIGSWTTPAQVSSCGFDAFNPQVALDEYGNAIAIWARKNEDNFIIQSATKSFEKPWEQPINVSLSCLSGQDASFPQIILNPNGGAYAVWQKNNGETNVIEFASWDSELKKWSEVTILSNNHASGLGCTKPRIASNRFGDVFAVWCNNEKNVVQTALGRNGGNWSKPKALSESGNQVLNAQIAIDLHGNAVAAWTRSNGTDFIVQASSRHKGSKWQKPVNLSMVGQSALLPSLSMNLEGNTVISWQRSNGVHSVVQLATKEPGFNWSLPINLTARDEDATDSQAVIGPSNEVFVAWKISDGENFVIQASTGQLESCFFELVTLSEPFHDAVNPQIAINEIGSTVAVWKRSDGINTVTQASFKSIQP